MTELTKASVKGQIVIPQGVRMALGILPGDTLQVDRDGDVIIIKKITLAPLRRR